MTNAEFAKQDKPFIAACASVSKLDFYTGFEPTTRQASKWRNKKGIAYKLVNGMLDVNKWRIVEMTMHSH